VVALAILVLIMLLGACAIAGWTADSRDSTFGLWPLAGARDGAKPRGTPGESAPGWTPQHDPSKPRR
jgi:hypothetical protein